MFAALVFVVCLPLARAAPAEPAPLVIGASDNFPPINLLDSDGQLDGFGRELSTAVVEAVGREAVYRHSSNWTEVMGWLETGQVDLVHDAAIIEEREGILDYSEPILSMPVVIFVSRERLDIRGFGDLEGHPVACVRAHVSHLWLQRFPDVRCRVVDTPMEGLYALLGGEVHAFVYPEQIVHQLAQDLRVEHLIKIEGDPLLEMSWAMAVRDGDREMVALLNEGLQEVKASGRYADIYDRWFGRPLLGSYSQRELLVGGGAITSFALLLGIAIGLWVRSVRLRRANQALEQLALQRQESARRHQAQEEYYLSLLDSSTDIIAVLDEQGRLIYVNGGVQRHLGSETTSLLGVQAFAFIPEEERAGVRERFERVLRDPGISIVHSHHLVHADGSRRPFETSAQAVWTEHGLRVVAGVRDTSERERAREAIERSQEQVAQAQKLQAIAQLAGGAAHDFNNLLTVILAAVGSLEDEDEDPEEKRQCAVDIRVASERAAGLTRRLLAFGGRQVLQPRLLELDELVGGMRKLLRRTLREDIQLHMELRAQDARVEVDPTQLEQVLVNLVINARDAMDAGGVLRVTTATVPSSGWPMGCGAPRPGVVLEVSDTGAGMTPEVRARIFEPFFSTKRERGGTGLGLSTVHGIVTQSGGGIEVDSAPGRGTAFRVFLPLVQGQVREAEPVEGVPNAPSARPRLLLVEDEARVRDRLVRGLRRRGFQVLAASGGQAALALDLAMDEPVDVLVTDVVMPGLSGPELARELCERHPGLRVLFMSGHADDEMFRRKALSPGQAFLAKPFQLEQLEQRILELVGTQEHDGSERAPVG